MATNPAFFRAAARSRHPRLHIDYDSAQHRYQRTYLDPNGYDIDLDAFPGVEEQIVTVIDHTGGNVVGKKTQQVRERLKIPEDAVSYDWKIERVDKLAPLFPGGSSSFSLKKSNPIVAGSDVGGISGAPYKQSFHVPSADTYEITLQLRVRSGPPIENRVTMTLHDFLVVSIGESAASGEGNPDEPGKLPECAFDPFHPFESADNCIESVANSLKTEFTKFAELANAKLDFEKDPIWLEEKAHRSLRSGPARAARAMENLGRGTMVTFLSFARSGSEIQGGLLGPRTKDNKPNDPWIGNIGQIQEIKNTIGKRRIDALVISIGGNDIGFADDLTSLVTGDLFGNDDANREKLLVRIDKALANLDEKVQKLVQAVAELNVSEVYLTQYPTALFDKMRDGKPILGGACGIFDSFLLDADLDIKDIRLVRDSAVKLNERLAKAAADHRWFFINGIDVGFAGHGYCSDDPFFWSAEQSFSIQGDINGIMHPNLKGHAIYASQIAAAVRQSTINPVLKRDEGPVVAPANP